MQLADVSSGPNAVLEPGPALERFCVALCHDLRGPVATAGAAIHSLARGLPPENADLPRLLEIARQSLAKADELLTSLPALLAREAQQRLAPVAVDEVVADVRSDVDFELRLAGAAFEVRGRLPVVLADRERLRIALRNLVRNAIQHRRSDVAALVTLRAWRRGDTWTLTLSDNGTGIPRNERARVFAPLARGSSAPHAGSGLGLTIARRAIEACGGTLVLATRAGSGASFAVTLHAADRRARARGATRVRDARAVDQPAR
jgi:signal transduction histidine kinase